MGSLATEWAIAAATRPSTKLGFSLSKPSTSFSPCGSRTSVHKQQLLQTFQLDSRLSHGEAVGHVAISGQRFEEIYQRVLVVRLRREGLADPVVNLRKQIGDLPARFQKGSSSGRDIS